MARGLLRRLGDLLFGDEGPRERASTVARQSARQQAAEEAAFNRFMKMREQIFSEYERLSRWRRQSDLLETLSIMREIRNFSEEFSNGHNREPSMLQEIAQLASILLLSGRGLPSAPVSIPPSVATPPEMPQPQQPQAKPVPPQKERSEPSSPQPLTDEQAVLVGFQILLADALQEDEDPGPYLDLILQKMRTHPQLHGYIAALAELPAEAIVRELARVKPSLKIEEAIPRLVRFQMELREALSEGPPEEQL